MSRALRLKDNSRSLINLVQVRALCHKSKLKAKKVYRWPYETVQFTRLTSIWDPMSKKKFNENSKIIQVEGNICAGKEEFAKELAEELGMKYLPKVNLDNIYINKSGYDYRALNPLLPERLRICDLKMFHENPMRHSVIHMQHQLFTMRVFQYGEALRHVFNTGQGVVMVRSAFTDRVFVEAMHQMGWLPKGYLRGDGVKFYDWRIRYNYIRNLVLVALNKPHLTIYLDTPVDTCLERIKNHSDPVIRDSKALTREFLEHIENAYTDTILPKMDHHGHVMKVEHSRPKTKEEINDVIDDAGHLDYVFDWHDTRFEEWNQLTQFWYHRKRIDYTSVRFLKHCNILIQEWYDIAGMGDSITAVDLELRKSLYESQVGPYGYFRDLVDDRSLFRRFFNIETFHEKCDKSLRSDFA